MEIERQEINVHLDNIIKIRNRGIILELEHSEDGLAQGDKLTCSVSGNSWKIIARVLLDHAELAHKIFDNESLEFLLRRFDTTELENESIEEIIAKEKKGIYFYRIKSLDSKNNEHPIHTLFLN